MWILIILECKTKAHLCLQGLYDLLYFISHFDFIFTFYIFKENQVYVSLTNTHFTSCINLSVFNSSAWTTLCLSTHHPDIMESFSSLHFMYHVLREPFPIPQPLLDSIRFPRLNTCMACYVFLFNSSYHYGS